MMKNLNRKNSTSQNQTEKNGETQTRKRINSNFIKRLFKKSNSKKTYTYGVINLRQGTIKRVTAEY